MQGFSRLAGILASDDVGMLLSTSSARESHEWEALQAGVFSHAIRSGLHGAADADGNGRVSYREVAAFVQRANAAIPNEKYRSRVFARPPRCSQVLVDLRRRGDRRLEVDGAHHGRYRLEDERGGRRGADKRAALHLAGGVPPPRREPAAGRRAARAGRALLMRAIVTSSLLAAVVTVASSCRGHAAICSATTSAAPGTTSACLAG